MTGHYIRLKNTGRFLGMTKTTLLPIWELPEVGLRGQVTSDVLWLSDASEKVFRRIFGVSPFIGMLSYILGENVDILPNNIKINKCQILSAFAVDSLDQDSHGSSSAYLTNCILIAGLV